MKVKRYYIDVENIGRAWLEHFKNMTENDFMTLFTSKKTCAHYEDFIYVFNSNKKEHFKILEAYVRGNGDSALDYFLMGVVNNEVKVNPDDVYIIPVSYTHLLRLSYIHHIFHHTYVLSGHGYPVYRNPSPYVV